MRVRFRSTRVPVELPPVASVPDTSRICTEPPPSSAAALVPPAISLKVVMTSVESTTITELTNMSDCPGSEIKPQSRWNVVAPDGVGAAESVGPGVLWVCRRRRALRHVKIASQEAVAAREELLRSVPSIASLDEEEIAALATALMARRVASGETVFAIGQVGKFESRNIDEP